MKNYVRLVAFTVITMCFLACNSNRNRDQDNRDTLSGSYMNSDTSYENSSDTLTNPTDTMGKPVDTMRR